MPTSPNAIRSREYLTSVLNDGGVALEDSSKIIAAVFVYIWGRLLTADTAAAIGGAHNEARSREQFLWGLDHLMDSFRRAYADDPIRSVP
jgi:hypothetical protein